MFRLGLIITAVGSLLAQTNITAEEKPNIVIILVDDLGFSDIGSYGGEINTPNLDRLAKGGVKFSNFYNNSRCCPTRAGLMTGLAPHLTGIGWMSRPFQNSEETLPSYQGYLNDKCVTIAEVLNPAGYATFLSGKWHLAPHQTAKVFPLGETEKAFPLARGFEKFYGLHWGASNFFCS